MVLDFAPCEICGARQWTDLYRGPLRDGAFGATRDDGLVALCGGCGVGRLSEDKCIPESYYQTKAYRSKLKEGLTSADYYAAHDELQIHTLRAVWPLAMRGATIADVGCGAGALLDHLRGYTSRQVAIEPCELYRPDLEARGFHVYPYAAPAAADWGGRVDVAFSIQVIEHVTNPRAFLEQIRPLLRMGGSLILSTPNRRDVLLDLLPAEYGAFFYRVVHRWYFDAASLAACARLAGFAVVEIKHVHRYGLANVLRWLRDRRPGGSARLPGIEAMADDGWISYLERTGRSDCLYMVLRPDA